MKSSPCCLNKLTARGTPSRSRGLSSFLSPLEAWRGSGPQVSWVRRAGGPAALLLSFFWFYPSLILQLYPAYSPHSWGVHSHSKEATRTAPSFFFFLSHAPQGLWNLSSLARDWTWAKAMKARILTTRPPGNRGLFILKCAVAMSRKPSLLFLGCGTSGPKELQRDMSGCVSLLGTPFWPTVTAGSGPSSSPWYLCSVGF